MKPKKITVRCADGPATVSGYPFEWNGLTFYVHRRAQGSQRMWDASEPTVGKKIGGAQSRTRRETVRKACELLDGYGYDKVIAIIMDEVFGQVAA